MLDPESASSSTCASPPIPAPRLRALACFFSSGVADVLACVRRFAVRCDPFRNSYLLLHAPGDQSRSSPAENGLITARARCPQRVGKKPRFLRSDVCAFGDHIRIVFGAVTDAKQRPGFPPDPPLAQKRWNALSSMYFFSAKGAAFTTSLGQRPRIRKTKNR